MDRGLRQGAIPTDLGALIDRLDAFSRRLSTLEAPSGESLANSVQKLSDLVANIQAQLDAWVAGRYDNATIDALIDAKIAAALAGDVTVGGRLDVDGDLDVDGTLRAGGIAATDLTTTSDRFTVWSGPDGKLGHT